MLAGGSLLVNNPPKVTTDGPFNLACPGSVTMHGVATDDDGDSIKYNWDLTSSTGMHTRFTPPLPPQNPLTHTPPGIKPATWHKTPNNEPPRDRSGHLPTHSKSPPLHPPTLTQNPTLTSDPPHPPFPAGTHLTRLTKDPVLANPDHAIPAGNYSVILTAVDAHGSRAVTTTSMSVAACPAPASNRPPTPVLTGTPYTLSVCNGTGSVTLDASKSSDPDAGDKIGRFVWEVSCEDAAAALLLLLE